MISRPIRDTSICTSVGLVGAGPCGSFGLRAGESLLPGFPLEPEIALTCGKHLPEAHPPQDRQSGGGDCGRAGSQGLGPIT